MKLKILAATIALASVTAVIFFFTLAETGSSDKLPLITIPAQ